MGQPLEHPRLLLWEPIKYSRFLLSRDEPIGENQRIGMRFEFGNLVKVKPKSNFFFFLGGEEGGRGRSKPKLVLTLENSFFTLMKLELHAPFQVVSGTECLFARCWRASSSKTRDILRKIYFVYAVQKTHTKSIEVRNQISIAFRFRKRNKT